MFKSVYGNCVLGSTGRWPVPSGDSPDGMGGAWPANQDGLILGAALLVPVGGSPTGTGGSPVLPIFQIRSKARSRAICLVVALLASRSPAARGQDSAWHEFPGGHWAALSVSTNGKTGFSLLTGAQTGITFTNSLDDQAAAANRVLYNGSGVAAGDFDNDGLPDLYFCSLNGRNTLYKNLGGWRFADVTEEAGLKRDQRFYRGAVFEDVNADGKLDLLVCVLGGGVECYLNNGRGKFTSATAAAHTASVFASTTLALADVDGNGTLDLYVANNRTEDIRDRGQVNLQLVDGKMTARATSRRCPGSAADSATRPADR